MLGSGDPRTPHGAPPDPTVITRGPNGSPCRGMGHLKTPTVTTWRPPGHPAGCLQPSLLRREAPPDPTARTRHPPPAARGIPTGSCDPPDPTAGAIPPQANTCPVPPRPAGLGVLGVAVPRARAAGRKGKPSPPAHRRGGRGPLFALPGHLHSGEQRPPLGVPGDRGGHRATAQPDALLPLPAAGANSWKSDLLRCKPSRAPGPGGGCGVGVPSQP